MNKADSERIAADLKQKGYKPAVNEKAMKTSFSSLPSPRSPYWKRVSVADLIVVNMCSVRQSAVDRVYGLIPKFKKLKAKTILTGCILKKDKEKLKDYFDEIKKIPRSSCPSALIPISNGCNNFCTYCVVPSVRGRLICRNHQEILEEAKNAVKHGFKEIWLLGQNVNDYQSPAQKSINFAKLLKQVNDLPGSFSIRFMSPHPKNFTNELIEVMAKSKNVAKYLNLPLQSGDNEILKRMNRNYTVKQYKDLVKKIRKKIPAINLSTDVIVGFPGETKKQFKNTVKLFKELKFDMAYISKYSQRTSTAACQLKDTIPIKEKKQREKVLRKLIKK